MELIKGKSKKNILFASIGGILIVLVLLFVFIKYGTNNKRTQSSIATESPLPNVMDNLNQTELQQYYDTYKKPYIIYVRTALDAYLAHNSSKACILKVAVASRTEAGIITGLDSFSKDYYKSKFVVVTIDDSKVMENAKDIQIMFQDKPDRLFYAMIGLDPSNPKDGEYCLLGFNSKEKMDQDYLQQTIEFYKPLFFDKEHAL